MRCQCVVCLRPSIFNKKNKWKNKWNNYTTDIFCSVWPFADFRSFFKNCVDVFLGSLLTILFNTQKNLLGNDHEIHNQEMKLFKFGFSILVKTKVFVAFVIAYSYQVLYVKKSQNFR